MDSRLQELFEDEELVKKIQKKLPYLFKIAALECSRAGKIGMEVGSIRERILVALLIYKFGRENVKTDIPITKAETDVELFGIPISIKTVSNNGGIKLIWTVDHQKATEFCENYIPECDLFLAKIAWGSTGGLYYIPRKVQQHVLSHMGPAYFSMPKQGTNPRGVELSKTALLKLMNAPDTRVLNIRWCTSQVKFDAHLRWIEEWKKD